MQIYARVSGCPGLTSVEVNLDHTVLDLKECLIQKCSLHISPSNLRLYSSRDLPDDATVEELRLQHGCTVDVTGRLLGGGGDGGSTGAESRSCYLEMYMERKPDKVNPAEEKLAKWTRCHLSGQALSPPCVCDLLGNLFNKDVLVQALLSKSLPKHLSHIRGLKSLINMKLHKNESNSNLKPKMTIQSTFQESNDSEFSCPVSGLEINGRFPFLVHSPTGYVISKRALKDAPAAVEELLGQKWTESDLIVLNPTGDELEKAMTRLAETAAVSKKKSRVKNGAVGEAAASTAPPKAEKRPKCDTDHQETAAARSKKKTKVLDHMPAHSTKQVYSSLFHHTSSSEKETYLCRSTSARGFAMS